jgi:hypothetical protein
MTPPMFLVKRVDFFRFCLDVMLNLFSLETLESRFYALSYSARIVKLVNILKLRTDKYLPITVPLTVASLFVSTLSLIYSAWRLQRADFHFKDLWSYTYTLGERIKQVNTCITSWSWIYLLKYYRI